jgi:hypothetical protein
VQMLRLAGSDRVVSGGVAVGFESVGDGLPRVIGSAQCGQDGSEIAEPLGQVRAEPVRGGCGQSAVNGNRVFGEWQRFSGAA